MREIGKDSPTPRPCSRTTEKYGVRSLFAASLSSLFVGPTSALINCTKKGRLSGRERLRQTFMSVLSEKRSYSHHDLQVARQDRLVLWYFLLSGD